MKKISAVILIVVMMVGVFSGCGCIQNQPIVGTWNEVDDCSTYNLGEAEKYSGIWVEDIPNKESAKRVYLRPDGYNRYRNNGYPGRSWTVDEKDSNIIYYNAASYTDMTDVDTVTLDQMERYRYNPQDDILTNIVEDSIDEIRLKRLPLETMVLNSDNTGTYGDREAKWEYDSEHQALTVKVKRPEPQVDPDGQKWVVWDQYHFRYDKEKKHLLRRYKDDSESDETRYFVKETQTKQ